MEDGRKRIKAEVQMFEMLSVKRSGVRGGGKELKLRESA